MNVSLKYGRSEGFKIIQIKTKDEPRKRANLKLIYATLVEMASDVGSYEFFFWWNDLFKYCGLSKTTLRRYTPMLEELGLIETDKKKINNNDENDNENNLNNVLQLSDIQLDSELREDLRHHNKLEQDKIFEENMFKEMENNF